MERPYFNWNSEFINKVFDRQAAASIEKIKPVPSEDSDKIFWTPSKTGDCSTKNAFRYHQLQVQLPSHGASRVSPGALYILKRIWNCRFISRVVKTILWRLIRRAIASGQRAEALSDKIDKTRAYCGAIENDAHLFFFIVTSLEQFGSQPKCLFYLLFCHRNKMECN